MPKEELKIYFSERENVKYLAFDEYKKLIDDEGKYELLQGFFEALGVKSKVDIRWEIHSGWLENETRYIAAKKSREKSLVLWSMLLDAAAHMPYILKASGTGTLYLLKQERWLLNKSGEFVKASDAVKNDLGEEYDVSSEAASVLLEYLGIKSADDEEVLNEFKQLLEKDPKEAKRFLETYKKQLEQKQRSENDSLNIYDVTNNDNKYDEVLSGSNAVRSTDKNTTKHDVSFGRIEHHEERAGILHYNPNDDFDDFTDEEDYSDEDEFTPRKVDYKKRRKSEEKKSSVRLERLSRLEALQDRAEAVSKYSFEWFKIWLETEMITKKENTSDSREVSISFAKVEREPDTKRTLVLKNPNRYIPAFMEDLADIPVILHMKDGKTKTVAIEVANIKSYTLRVKLRSGEDIDDIDLSNVAEATIDAQSPVFLIEALKKQFESLGLENERDMKKDLCENIEFVFGPPGTGKTTYLARNVIIPIMGKEAKSKVLVLTPTNKAADVIASRIMKELKEDRSYRDWLVRFGTTDDEEIEQNGVLKEKTFNIHSMAENVTVTTMARFPYDYFMPEGKRMYLYDIDWDYIIIDEASMIPLVNIILPLYKLKPKKFIIAGDPFQIEPIITLEQWKGENIYTMVGLKSFKNPETSPFKYKVTPLMTQYRSIPEIGAVFSKLTYDGVLEHYRDSKSMKTLGFEEKLNIMPLNIIKFPVSRYESIYRAKRLQKSAYQIYSALFTYEYISFLAKKFHESTPGSFLRIGVISPYKAQAELIEQLLESEKLPKEVEVQAGTIHGFQGDECDMVFVVFTSPPKISDSAEMFLNKKNIINVSVSRARDYLFIIMPDDDTDDIEKLSLIKRLEGIIKKSGGFTEKTAAELEETIFGEADHLENNVFSTSHQIVNVYGMPEKYYEVRTEDNAVDIQIHREKTAL